jgi:hypothetical protein
VQGGAAAAEAAPDPVVFVGVPSDVVAEEDMVEEEVSGGGF